MSQRAFFSTAGSEIISQSQILDGLQPSNFGPAVTSVQFQSSGSTSVLYQSAVTPAFYSTTGSPFHSTGAFLPPSIDDRKEYVAVLPGVQISDASGLIPASGRGTLASVGTAGSSTPVSQLTPVTLSHVHLRPVQLSNESQSNQIIYEQYYVDQQHPTTSSAINLNSEMRMNEGSQIIRSEIDSKDNLKSGRSTRSGSLSDTQNAALILKRQKQADAARQRYQRMTAEERREVNAKRTLAQKRKKQREKELEELESLLRESRDIEDDPNINEQLREKRIRARRAEAARLRYQRMSSEERRTYNQKRRFRQLGLQGTKKNGTEEDKIRQNILEQNAKKAEAARLRYHRMSPEEKKLYNQRRTEAFRRRRIEEEILLSTPAGRISAEALSRAQQIMMRNAKRAEAARLRYQRMTPDQRRAYNQKRSRAKKDRERVGRSISVDGMSVMSSLNDNENSLQLSSNTSIDQQEPTSSNFNEEVLSVLEKEVIRRTKQANLILMKQKKINSSDQFVIVSTNPDGSQTIIPSHTTDDGKQIFHLPSNTPMDDVKQFFQIPSSTMSMVEEPVKFLGIQQPLQVTASPLIFDLQSQQQRAIINSNDGDISGTSAETDGIPELAELHNVQQNVTIMNNNNHSAVQMHDDTQHRIRNQMQVQHLNKEQMHNIQRHHVSQQSRNMQQHMAINIHEVQQPMQHQIIVTDLNQSTGAVLSSAGNVRSRGRPPIYAAAAAALQQHQQGTVTVLQSGQIVTSPDIINSDSKQMHHISSDSLGSARNRHDILAVATAASVGSSADLTPDQKLELQRAKRAERARLRYHNMSSEERRNFNARRASALRKARLRDEQLCQLAETAGDTLDEETMTQVLEAQRRRAKRAEAARMKYHRMTSEERRQYNAMRDAQRRQRKKDREQQELIGHRQQNQEQNEHQDNDNNDQMLYGSYIRYDQNMDHGWAVES